MNDSQRLKSFNRQEQRRHLNTAFIVFQGQTCISDFFPRVWFSIKKEKDTFVFYSWSYTKFCLCFFESKSMVRSLLSRSKSLCTVFTFFFFCCCSKYIYIKRNHDATDLRSARRATPVKGFVYRTAGGLSLPPSTHPLLHGLCCSLTNHSSSCLISYSKWKAVEIYACFLLLFFILQWQHMHSGS